MGLECSMDFRSFVWILGDSRPWERAEYNVTYHVEIMCKCRQTNEMGNYIQPNVRQ